MNSVLWIIQALLASAYLLFGGVHAFGRIDAVSKRVPWMTALPLPVLRGVGIAELVGASGLILPLATNILPWLTPTAAGGLVLVQVSALAFHAPRREYSSMAMNLVLLVLAAFVLYGRTMLAVA